MNSYFLCLCLCYDLRMFFFQKHKHWKDLRHKGMPNEEICWEIFTSNTATGHMAYGSGSTAPLRSKGIVREDTEGPQYEDMSIGEYADDDHMSPSPPPPTFGVSLLIDDLSPLRRGGGSRNKCSSLMLFCKCGRKRTKNLNTPDLCPLPSYQTCLTLVKIS